HKLRTEAAASDGRPGHDANHRHTAFGPTNVTLYQVSIAQVLGDNGAAIKHAAAIRSTDIPTPERQGRYWIDVARAYHQWGRPEQCYRALLAAERTAPGEVRYRPPVHRMTLDLLHADRRHAFPESATSPPGSESRHLPERIALAVTAEHRGRAGQAGSRCDPSGKGAVRSPGAGRSPGEGEGMQSAPASLGGELTTRRAQRRGRGLAAPRRAAVRPPARRCCRG